MSGSRTEKPTPKRLRDARRRGEVAISRELTSAAALAAGFACLSLCGAAVASGVARHLRAALAAAVVGEVSPVAALRESAWRLAGACWAPLTAAALAAIVAGLAQTGGACSFAALAPRWSRVSPGAGVRRLASTSQAATVALGACKVAAVAAAAWQLRGDVLAAAARAAATTAGGAIGAIAGSAATAGAAASLLLVAAGAADLLVVRRRHARALRMTLEEVRREQKEEDGDPQHRAERRRIHRSLAAAMPVSAATCVVVNPTHVAVALHHDASADDAPVVIAKGSGEQALRIRTEARLAAVPVVEDVPLARALYRLADVGDEIPEELYEAAAAVLVHVHGLATENNP